MSVVERKYAMTRIGPGDYLLPANDGATLWRIYSYEEDGSAERMDGSKVLGTFWMAAKFDTRVAQNDLLPYDFLEWHRWEPWTSTLTTRREAIKAALAV